MADPSEIIGITLRPDQVPAAWRKEITDWIENTSRLAQQFTLPFENAKHRALRGELIKFAAAEHLMWIKETAQISHSVKLNRKTNRFTAETKLVAKPSSKLAGRFADVGKGQSLFAALTSKNQAMGGAGHLQLPAEHRKVLGTVVDELLEHAEKHAKAWHRESDLAIVKALAASVKSGEMDHGFSLRGPTENGFYTFVCGARIKNGGVLDKALRNRVKELPAKVKKTITLDAEKVGQFNVHRVDLPEKAAKRHEKVFGKNPIYFALRDDALMVATGEKGLAALNEALSAQPQAAPAGQFSLSVARLAAGFGKDRERIARAAREAFGKDQNGGQVTFLVEGGDSIRMRLDVDTSIMKFAAKALRPR
jgi:hypothetical protein